MVLDLELRAIVYFITYFHGVRSQEVGRVHLGSRRLGPPGVQAGSQERRSALNT